MDDVPFSFNIIQSELNPVMNHFSKSNSKMDSRLLHILEVLETSCMSNTGLIVDVYTNSQDRERGTLNIKSDGLLIMLNSGKTITSQNSPNALLSLVEYSNGSQFRFRINPTLAVIRPYAADKGQVVEDIFPSSTGGFYGRLRAGKADAVYTVHAIESDSRFMLLIGNHQSGSIYESQVIQPYEAEALGLIDGQEHQNMWYEDFWSGKKETLRKEIRRVLDGPSPSWDEVSNLLSEVSIPNLQLGETTRETVSQLVPSAFSESDREQLEAFLAYIMLDRISMEEVIVPSSHIDALPMFGTLMRGHFRCIVDKQDWPPYLKLMLLASRGQLEQPKVTLDEAASEIGRKLVQKVIEICPDWFAIASKSAQELNNSNKFLPRLPVTKSQAMRSRKKWKIRLSAISYGLRARSHVNHSIIGLNDLIYLGAAYRWPHRHMRFITRLGITNENPPHLHVMSMPPPSVERVMRVLPQCIKIFYSTRVVNHGLFNENDSQWEVPIDKIVISISKRVSMRRFSRRFFAKKRIDTFQIQPDEAKVLGLLSAGIYLESLEAQGYFKYWDLDRKQVISSISRLQRNRVIDVVYEVDDVRLVSLASIVQGNSDSVISLVDSFLTYTPTSTVMLNKECDTGIILSRLPENDLHELASQLNRLDDERDVTIRCMRPRTFRSFSFDFYSRLLNSDGTWDDDVSAFLSQARSKRKELSDEQKLDDYLRSQYG